MLPVPMRETIMRRVLMILAAAALTPPVAAQSVDSLVAKYLQSTGGLARMAAVTTLRRTGKFTGGGGFEATVVQENKRPNAVREEFAIQGMTGIQAYDRRAGWKIPPWQGQKAAEAVAAQARH